MRAWLWAAVVVAGWLVSTQSAQPRRVVPAAADPTSFSAVRAATILARFLGPEQPHPLSSPANAAVRERIRAQFAALQVPTHNYQAFICNSWRGFGYVPCASVTDVIAEVLPGTGPAIVMAAHYDSVPAGPGAADDGSGVAAVLEVARALRAERSAAGQPAAPLHPVVALISDGEEEGLLGAAAFLQNDAMRRDVGVVINLEARGTRGSSLLFQTSARAGALIDLYATQAPAVAASSLYADIYQRLPNDTDLTLFLRAGIPGLNFAFVDNVRYYHSPQDLRGNLNTATLQMQGDSLLGLVRGLEHRSYSSLLGPQQIYLSVLNHWLPRLPIRWALPLALASLATIALTLTLRPRDAPAGRLMASVLLPPALLIGGTTAAWILTLLAQWVSGMPDPSYAYPIVMRWALGLGLWTVALALARLSDARRLAASVWLWMSAAAVLSATVWPAASPYWLFPSVVAALVLALAATAPVRLRRRSGELALAVAAVAALIVWLGLAQSGETLMGLRQFTLLTTPAALALTTVLPLLGVDQQPRRRWLLSVSCSGSAALLAAVLAGLVPAYTAASPERVNLMYLEDSAGARWIADSSWKLHRPEPIPTQLRSAGPFALAPAVAPQFGVGSAYVVPARAAHLPLPTASVISDTRQGTLRTLQLRLRSSPSTDVMTLYIPQSAKLYDIDLRGQHLVVPPGWAGATRLLCFGRDCDDELVTLRLGADPAGLRLAEERYELPDFGAYLQRARPATAMPSQTGDETLLINDAPEQGADQ